MAAWTGDTGWDAAERDDFIKQYKQVVESTWSGAHAMRCVRPGWEQIVAVPRLRIEVVDPEDDPHYVVTVHGASDDPMAMDTQRPLVGESGLFGGPGHAEMDQDDVASRPISVHVKAEAVARLEALLPKPGVRVVDDGAAARVPPSELGPLRKVADGLDRSAQYPSGPQLAIEPVGWASEPGAFEASLRGATAVGEALADLAPGRSEARVVVATRVQGGAKSERAGPVAPTGSRKVSRPASRRCRTTP